VVRFWITLLLAGCTTWELDATQPIADVSGSPPSLDGHQLIPWQSCTNIKFVTGVDETPWAVFTPSMDVCQTPVSNDRMVRLGDPADEEVIPNTVEITLGTRAIFLSWDEYSGGPSHLLVRRPGDDGGQKFDFADYLLQFMQSPNDDVLLLSFEVPRMSLPQPVLFRTDGSFRRTLPAVGMVSRGAFDRDGTRFFRIDDAGNLIAYSTSDMSADTLGTIPVDTSPLPPELYADDRDRLVVVCSGSGLWTFPYSGGAGTQLDPGRCLQSETEQPSPGYWIYSGDDERRSVPLDGSAPPRSVQEPINGTKLAVTATGIAYSLDYDDMRFKPANVSDGWVDGTRFMERGLQAGFSADGNELYFIEHAASGSGVGELLAYHRDTGSTVTLAHNSYGWKLLDDGRVLASANAAYVGDWNRIVVIDEARRRADWVAASGAAFTPVPDANEVLVTLSSADEDKTLVRMPIPERR
jgi:hypothetical protein